jgi:prepilin-type N-terminal cleavage/methylation domain-containing protein
MRTNPRGFTLVELLIVLAIIVVLAALAIPNLLRSQVAANQASAITSLRTISTAETSYATTYDTGYSPNLGCLGPPAAGQSPTATAAGLIDSLLAGSSRGNATATLSVKTGYQFTYTPEATDTTGRIPGYAVYASPLDPGRTGTLYYYTDNTGVIRQNGTLTAGSADSQVPD